MNAPLDTQVFTRLATEAITPAAKSKTERTLIIKASTGADVPRFNLVTGEKYIERLQVTEDAVDRSILKSGQASVVDSHNTGSTAGILASIDRSWIEGGALYVEARFPPKGTSQRIDEVYDLIDAGILKGASLGYRIMEWKRSDEGGNVVYTAVRWRPFEVSIVVLGADLGAMIERRAFNSVGKEELAMEEGTLTRGANAALGDGDIVKIRSMINAMQIDDNVGAEIMSRARSQTEARSMILDAVTRSQEQTRINTASSSGFFGGGEDPRRQFIAAAGEALFTRHHPRHRPSDSARPYIGQSVVDFARHALELNGRSLPLVRTPGAIIERALHTTSDFPALLTNAGDRTLREAYNEASSGLRKVAAERKHRDFRGQARISLDSSSLTFEAVGESGEFKRGTMEVEKATYRLYTYGGVFGLSRQALVNDDLGAFGDMNAKLGRRAAAFEAQKLVDQVTANGGVGPTFEDTFALFSSQHGNLAGAGGAISEATVSAARLAMRSQTGKGGGLISVSPKYLIVGAAKETEAEKFLATIAATTTDDVNPFAGKLELVVEPRLSGNAWYLAADQTQIDGLSYAYLEDESGPQLFTREGFDVDGIEFKVRLDYGCGFDDWRGWYRNPGN